MVGYWFGYLYSACGPPPITLHVFLAQKDYFREPQKYRYCPGSSLHLILNYLFILFLFVCLFLNRVRLLYTVKVAHFYQFYVSVVFGIVQMAS